MSFFQMMKEKWREQFPHGLFVTKESEAMIVKLSDRDTTLFEVLPKSTVEEGSTTTSVTTTNEKGESTTTSTTTTNVKEVGGLYIGSVWTIGNQVMIHKVDVKSVVTVVSDLGPYARTYQQASMRLKNTFGIEVSRLPWKDTVDQTICTDDLTAVLRYIHSSRHIRGSVLVHCIAGRSRSAAVIVCYLLAVSKGERSYDECVEEVRRVREEVDINEGFAKQIIALVDEGFFRKIELQGGSHK